MNFSQLVARIRRILRPPRIAAVTRRPSGWFAVGRRRLEPIVAWAWYNDDQVAGLVAGHRGLRLTIGRGYRGYLPPIARSSADIQPSPPAIAMPVADLVEAIGDSANPWTSDAQLAIFDRLIVASRDEWASTALRGFVADPERFLRRHLELRVEHMHPAELAESEREFLADLITANPDLRAGAKAGRQGDKPS